MPNAKHRIIYERTVAGGSHKVRSGSEDAQIAAGGNSSSLQSALDTLLGGGNTSVSGDGTGGTAGGMLVEYTGDFADARQHLLVVYSDEDNFLTGTTPGASSSVTVEAAKAKQTVTPNNAPAYNTWGWGLETAIPFNGVPTDANWSFSGGLTTGGIVADAVSDGLSEVTVSSGDLVEADGTTPVTLSSVFTNYRDRKVVIEITNAFGGTFLIYDLESSESEIIPYNTDPSGLYAPLGLLGYSVTGISQAILDAESGHYAWEITLSYESGNANYNATIPVSATGLTNIVPLEVVEDTIGGPEGGGVQQNLSQINGNIN